MSLFSRAVFFSLALLGFVPRSPGQNTAMIRGKVTDSSHAPLPDSRIAVNAGRRPASEPVMSDQSGLFTISLPPGNYILNVTRDGFQPVTRQVEVPASGADVEIMLEIAPVNSAVTIHESTGYLNSATSSATKTLTPLQDIPQSITVINQSQIKDQMMMSIADVVNYVPGVTTIQGENNRDQLVIRGNSTSADFFVDGVRDDVQFYRDLYDVDRVEVLKGPNALIFGRGGAGGVVNRVMKGATGMPLREVTVSGGSYGDKRFALDLDQPLTGKLAVRLNSMYEDSGTFRDYVSLERYGFTPAMTYTPTQNTKITATYEHFRDNRGSDRGIPSFQGLPVDLSSHAFFGNPAYNSVRALVNTGTIAIEHTAGRAHFSNRTTIADYDRGYQNFVPGAVSASGTTDSLSAYNNATQRRNLFNQTEVSYTLDTGTIRHTLLAGVEIGRQSTNNFRNTGYFNDRDTTVQVPLSNAVINTPVVFRQSATDANNHLKTNLGAAYVQDQVELSRRVQLIGGVRFDYFDLQYHDNRSGTNLRRIDHLVSPRAGLIFKPVNPLSLYISYSISYLPSSGDQFSSLTTITQQVKPEKFSNYEAGAKWSFSPRLTLTTAVYRLDRTNTRATDPNDATRIVQTGGQRTNGFEAGISGNITHDWQISGGYAYQDAFVTNATTAARAGALVAQVPHNTFSLWNSYRIVPRLSVGLGLLNRSDMFAAIDDTVRLPGYFRADAAVYYSINERVRLQMNVQNLADKKYYVNADNNTNISPGSPRAFVLGLITRF